jgi:hypothetical protein
MAGSPSRITVDSRKIEELDAAICNLARKLHADTFRMLRLIRDFDDRFGYAKWGHKTCAEWLHWRCQISLSAAREKVRTAQALRRLPKLSEAFAKGDISYTKVRALTRVATERDEELLLAYASKATAQDVEDRVRQMRNTAPESIEQARRAWERRSLTIIRSASRGTLMISVEVPAEDGEIIAKAIERAVASGDVAVGLDHFAAHGEDRSATDGWRAQQADALVVVAKAYLARRSARGPDEAKSHDEVSLQADGSGSGEDEAATESARSESTRSAPPLGTSVADYHQVIVHVDEKALRGGAGRSDLPLPTIQRLTCDCSMIPLIEDENGKPLALGRKTRNISTKLRRLLWARDKHCIFPGCHRKCYVDSHHIQHWANGGESEPGNLTLICSYHHVLLHEGGFSIRKLDDGTLEFLRPDGRVIPRSGYLRGDIIDDYEDVEGSDRVGAMHIAANGGPSSRTPHPRRSSR